MTSEVRYATAQLNARLQPIHRGDLFEDPLAEALSQRGLGEVVGGGTAQSKEGEVEYGDIEIRLDVASDVAAPAIIEILERLGAPKGSKLILHGEERSIPFGLSEGLAIYLNGTELPDEVYEQCDVNVVYNELDRLIEGCGMIFSHWQGPSDTALYLYGGSFEEMNQRIAEFVASYPLCQRCRIVQIA